MATLIGLAIAAMGWAFIVVILWRYPDFRRAFVEHWRPENVARRMDGWTERNRRR